MIDCHAHAYPSAFTQIERMAEHVVPGKGDVIASGVEKALVLGRGLAERFLHRGGEASRTPQSPALGVEALSRLQRSVPAPVTDLLERAVSTLLMPGVLVHGQLDELVESMERHGITKTVVIAAPPVATNDWLLGEATLLGEAVVPFVMLPQDCGATDQAGWRDALVDLLERGAGGFKLHPNMDGIPANHPGYRAMFELARERSLPVILHTGCFHAPIYRHQRPADPGEFEPLFRDFPEVRVCLAHMNRADPQRAWDIMKRHPQLYTDTSWQPAEAVQRAVREVGVDRILLGSDWPLLHPELQGESLAILRRAVSGTEARQIGEENAMRWLG